MKDSKIGDLRRVMDLLTLGELGRRIDLTAHGDVHAVLMANLDDVEDVKQAAGLLICFFFLIVLKSIIIYLSICFLFSACHWRLCNWLAKQIDATLARRSRKKYTEILFGS